MLLIQLWERADTLFTGGNHLHVRIILLTRNVGVHTTSLASEAIIVSCTIYLYYANRICSDGVIFG